MGQIITSDQISLRTYADALSNSFERCFPPWERMAPVEWPEKVYRLPGGLRFRWDYAPYIRAIYLSYFERQVRETVLKMFSRGLKSTSLLLLIGYHVDQCPRKILCLWPTNQQAEKWSKDILTGELLDTTPPLYYLGTRNKKRDGSSTLTHKTFPGGLIDMFGGNAPGDMRRAKGNLLLGDEIDALEQTVTDEGDQLAIFSKRGDEYPDTIRAYASYPALMKLDQEGNPMPGHSRVDSKFRESDANEWYSTCVLCGQEPFVMTRQMIRYDRGKTHLAMWECPRCHGFLNDDQRYEMAHKQGDNNWKATREFKGVRGYHASSMLWPHPVDRVKFPGGYIQILAEKEIEAQKSENPQRSMRVIVNTEDAEPFNPETIDEMPPDFMKIMERLEDYAPDDDHIVVPKGGLYITAGLDCQPTRIEIYREAWGREDEVWALCHTVIEGNIKDDSTWKLVEQELLREFDHETGAKIKLGLAFIDCGHGADHVLWFLRWLRERKEGQSELAGRIFACRGSSVFPHPTIDPTYSKLVKNLKGFWVGGDECKDGIYSHLKLTEPGKNYRHYGKNLAPIGVDGKPSVRFFAQLTCEKITIEGDKRRFNNDDKLRNEALDCSVYSKAAHKLRRKNWDVIENELKRDAEERRTPAKAEKPSLRMPSRRVGNSFAGTGGGKWV